MDIQADFERWAQNIPEMLWNQKISTDFEMQI